MTRALALSLLLAGCLSLPVSTIPQSPSDREAVDAAIAAFVEARGPITVDALDRVDVVSLPLDGDGQTVRGRCASQASSCVYVVQRYVSAPASTLIYVRDDADARTRAVLIVHETLHVLRAWWGVESLARYKHGERDDCEIAYPTDHAHCDTDLWVDVERAAIARWRRRAPNRQR